MQSMHSWAVRKCSLTHMCAVCLLRIVNRESSIVRRAAPEYNEIIGIMHARFRNVYF